MTQFIALDRQFELLENPSENSPDQPDRFKLLSDAGPMENWDSLLKQFRCVVLAEAGAGKTEEFKHQAQVLHAQKKTAFFIRIEEINANFYQAFDVGKEEEFNSWLSSTDEAWFFLDSVDEARLKSPRDFENAIKRFSNKLAAAKARAHVYVSSRPYAWRWKEDGDLMLRWLPWPQGGSTEKKAPPVYTMCPLNPEKMRTFCLERKAKNVDQLLEAIKKNGLESLAERPFDLGLILEKWAQDQVLAGRLEMILEHVKRCLREAHNTNRAGLQPFNREQAMQGVQRMAAAVALTGQANIQVPDNQSHQGMQASDVLNDWEPNEVQQLMELGVFNEVVYGAVRFRHREIYDFLAAKWFEACLMQGNSRSKVEHLFVREQYGEKVIVPRLRSVLSWLVLLDEKIRDKALGIRPELALEGGDSLALPLSVRKRMLRRIVQHLVDGRLSTQKHRVLVNIARKDLENDVQTLLLKPEYFENDDAMFFLLDVIERGRMACDLGPILQVVLNDSRDVWIRNQAAGLVMAHGSVEQQETLWNGFLASKSTIHPTVLTGVLNTAEANARNVQSLIPVMGKLSPYDSNDFMSLEVALHSFLDKLSTETQPEVLLCWAEGMLPILDSLSFIEVRNGQLPEEKKWILRTAVHALKRLIEVRSPMALQDAAISVLLKGAAILFDGLSLFDGHLEGLSDLIPNWPELNDALYWASIAWVPSEFQRPLPITDSEVYRLDSGWRFDEASLPRLLAYLHSKTDLNDRLAVLRTAVYIYQKHNHSADILQLLKEATQGDSVLRDQIMMVENERQQMRESEQKRLSVQLEQEEFGSGLKASHKRGQQARTKWIDELKNNPTRVARPSNEPLGGLRDDQWELFKELRFLDAGDAGRNWKALEPEFGEAVASAYREAAMLHWRHYTPNNRSVLGDSTRFARVGLHIEAMEVSNFPNNLEGAEVQQALRYITCAGHEGLSVWLKPLHHRFPALVNKAVQTELLFGLEQPQQEGATDLFLRALMPEEYLHSALVPTLVEWIRNNPTRLHANLEACLNLLISGGVEEDSLVELACGVIQKTHELKEKAVWYAYWVDCSPDSGMPALEQYLSGLSAEEATLAAQHFIQTLMGGSHGRPEGLRVGQFKTAKYLKWLYELMHRYVRVEDDIRRPNNQVYSPTLRDDAQDTRDRLFHLLTELPGHDAYKTLKALSDSASTSKQRSWMALMAYQRAEADADWKSFDIQKMQAFYKQQEFTPTSNQQLFELAELRLLDLKDWLENGNDSPWKTWQRVPEETEMRNLIAGWLRDKSLGRYSLAQEEELANGQRMDIRFEQGVLSQVPVELKLLDKNWTGPALCERLENQLLGDYFRGGEQRYGFFLLVAQNDPNKRWEIQNKKVSLDELESALQQYWEASLTSRFPHVEQVRVLVIDLAKRGRVSGR